MNHHSATIPLEEALPWSPPSAVAREQKDEHDEDDGCRTILICDTLQTDGRFLLYNMASQSLSQKGSSGGSVYWITGSPLSPLQIGVALKKMISHTGGVDAVSRFVRQEETKNRTGSSTTAAPPPWNNLVVVSIPEEMTNILLQQDTLQTKDESDGEALLKSIYKKVKGWLAEMPTEETSSSSPLPLVILDDVSAMSNLLCPERTTPTTEDAAVAAPMYRFIQSLIALSAGRTSSSSFSLLIRCSADWDRNAASMVHGKDTVTGGWMGAGGMALQEQQEHLSRSLTVPWERSLVEMVDAIVDVVPLSSGYSRDAHGRLILSEPPGGLGWPKSTASRGVNNTTQQQRSSCNDLGVVVGGGSSSKQQQQQQQQQLLVFNYCLQDSGVRAIRLREGTK